MITTIITNVERLRMEKIVIDRKYYDDCVVGRLTYKGFQCFTLELPYKDNQRNISCIPPASGYVGRKHVSPKNGECISINNVFHRTHIQIHKGNFTSDIEGCILVGDSVKFLNSDSIPDVTNSKNTLNKLLGMLPDKFTIEIK